MHMQTSGSLFFLIEAKLKNIYIVKLGSYFNHFFTNFIEVKYFNQSNEGTMMVKPSNTMTY